MKCFLRTATILLFVLLTAVTFDNFSPKAFAQSDSVTIDATVPLSDDEADEIRVNSTIEAKPEILPVGDVSTIFVTVRTFGGAPLPGAMVTITGVGPSGFIITQPILPTGLDGRAIGYITSDIGGGITLYADVTLGGRTVRIDDTAFVYFVPVPRPVMNPEPEFTKGLENEVSWSNVGAGMEYLVQVSTDEFFSTVVFTSGWISETSHVFAGLSDGVQYFYRVRARNEFGVGGEWSEVVFSTQDNTPPISEVTLVDVNNGVFAVSYEAFDAVSGVDYSELYYRKDGGSWVKYGRVNGSPATIDLSNLGPGEYCFSVVSVDRVGNEEIFQFGSDQYVCKTIPGEPTTPPTEIEPGDIIGQIGETIEQFVEQNSNALQTLVSISAITGIISLIFSLGLTLAELPAYLLQAFFWFIDLLGFTALGKPWGVVYDAITKAPLSRSVVRLFSGSELLDTAVTDVNGVFYFRPSAGRYTMTASRPGYKFPSRIVLSRDDGTWTNVYRGEIYNIEQSGEPVRVSIPIDPQKPSAARVFFQRFFSILVAIVRTVNPALLVLGILLCLIFYLLWGNIINLILLIINLLLLIGHFYLDYRMNNQWGYVMDEKGNFLVGVEIGLYETRYGKLVASRITDEQGRYHFVIPGDFYIVKPIDLEFVIAEDGKRDGYRVGRVAEKDILIKEVVRLKRRPIV